MACAALLLLLSGASFAGDVLDVRVPFDLAAQPLGDALRQLAKQANLQVLFAPELVTGQGAPAVSGVVSPRQAFDRLLAGTQLVAQEQAPGVIIVVARERDEPAGPTVAAAAARPKHIQSPNAEPEVVVVTAQRREERLQDVPISVSVYSRRSMDVRGMRTVEDISRLTPGVTLVHGTNYNSESSNISIRGIDSNAGAATTGIYIDDTPIHSRHLFFGTFNTYPMLFDIERVEVLHGPQGTLFGASTEGGAVRFITQEPALEGNSMYVRAEGAATAHGTPTFELGAAAGGPLIAGRLGLRLSGSYRHEGGYVDRIDWHTARMVDADSNWSSTKTARIALKWAPTDSLSIIPSISYQDRHVNDTAAWWAPVAGPSDPTLGQFDRPLRNGNVLANPSADRFVLPSLKIEFDARGLRFVSNTSYFDRRQSAISDYTEYDRAVFLGNPFPAPGDRGQGFWADEQKNWTQELRVDSNKPAARINWTAGAFYQHARENTVLNVFDPSLVEQLNFPVFDGGYLYVQDPFMGIDRQLAVFGQADLQATRRLKVTLGLRYSHTDFEGKTFYAGPVVGEPVASSGMQSERPVTPRFGLGFQLSDDHFIYATAAKGYRIGGANPAVGQFCYGPGSDLDRIGLANVPSTFSSDSVWSYELGSKSTFGDNRGQLNTSAYVIQWTDIQQNVQLTECGFQFVANLGAAQSRGFDLQGQYRVSDAMSFGGTVSYTDARFTRTVQLQPTVSSIVRKGDHLAASPWKVAVFGQLDVPLGARTGYLRADYQYNARQTDRVPNQNPLNGSYALGTASVPPQSFASLRAGMQSGRIDVSLFAQNLFDTRPRLTVNQDVGSPTGGTPLRYVITWPPRSVGITATYRY